ncbi:MAG: AbrB/MazE/SpoVT family DNA-binding domain-containing protein [Spirosomataceae bacterium]
MTVDVIKIGNSKGIRLSKTIIEQYNIGEQVEIIFRNDEIVLRPKTKVREGWADTIRLANSVNNDTILDEFSQINNRFDEEEWEWK